MHSIKKVFAHSIKQIFPICFLVITFSLLSVFGQTQKTQEAQLLSANQTIERELAGGQTQKYLITLKANQFLQVKVEQKGVDAVVKLFDKDGKQLAEMDSPNGTEGFEILMFIVADAGVYRVEVGSSEANAPKGNYTIFLETPRAPTEKDKKTLQAKVVFSEAEALLNQATAESYRAAREKFLAASRLYQEIGSKGGETQSLIWAGVISNRLGELRTALEYYNQALQLYQAASDKQGEAKTLSNIGVVYDALGEKQKALEYYNKSLLIVRAIGFKSGEPILLSNIAKIYDDIGEKQKALEHYNQALLLTHAIEDKTQEAITLNNLGKVYEVLGEKQKALEYYNQSLPLIRAVGLKNGEATLLSNIGRVYSDLGENQKALEYLNQSLLLAHTIGDKQEEARTLNNIGKVYFNLGEKQKAAEYVNQSLLLIRAVGDKGVEATLLSNIGRVYADLGDKQKALQYYNQSLPLARIAGDKVGEALILYNLMHLYKDFSNPRLAVVFGKQSVNTYQQLRSNIKGLNKSIQQTYLKSVENTYRLLAETLIEQGRLPEAQAVLDLLKEEEFKQIARRSGEPLFTLPYSRAEEEAIKIVDRLASIGRELSELKAKPKDSLTTAETKRISDIESIEIPIANKALRQATEALAVVAPDVKKALDLKMENNIQNILLSLGKGVVAIYTVIGKTSDENAVDKTASNKINVGWILLVTPDTRKAYPIDTANLEQTVFKLREALRNPLYDPQPIAQELYKKLFLQTSAKQKTTLAADLETYLRGEKDKTLMWSLDGVLRYVPMAALHNGRGYLVEKYRNVVFNTASLGTLLIAARPNWEVAALGVSTEGTVKAFDGRTLRFSALKDTEIELNSLVKEKNRASDDGIFSGTLRINKDFTKEALFEEARTGMPVIHISSHFWFNPAQEETSFLLLGNGGKLEMTEFQDYPNLFSNVDFLSLSACDTATGGNANNNSAAVTGKEDTEQKAREANGKEIEGFAYLAQTLGAKSVMASLWQVSDTGTKELMLKFYQIRKEQPDLPKSEALRQAQLSLLRGTNKAQDAESVEKGIDLVKEEKKAVAGLKPFKKDEKMPFGHPYYWSSFILIGNWR